MNRNTHRTHHCSNCCQPGGRTLWTYACRYNDDYTERKEFWICVNCDNEKPIHRRKPRPAMVEVNDENLLDFDRSGLQEYCTALALQTGCPKAQAASVGRAVAQLANWSAIGEGESRFDIDRIRLHPIGRNIMIIASGCATTNYRGHANRGLVSYHLSGLVVGPRGAWRTVEDKNTIGDEAFHASLDYFGKGSNEAPTTDDPTTEAPTAGVTKKVAALVNTLVAARAAHGDTFAAALLADAPASARKHGAYWHPASGNAGAKAAAHLGLTARLVTRDGEKVLVLASV